MQDRDEMLGGSYSGMGRSFQDHDRFAAECQGPIYDRTQEHLGTTDRPVIAAIGVGGRGLFDTKWASRFGDVAAPAD